MVIGNSRKKHYESYPLNSRKKHYESHFVNSRKKHYESYFLCNHNIYTEISVYTSIQTSKPGSYVAIYNARFFNNECDPCMTYTNSRQ